MIYNKTDYPLTDIYEYLAGFTTKLSGKIEVTKANGRYYDMIHIFPKK